MEKITKTKESITINGITYPWSEQLENALLLLISGTNCFVTGPGGVGKSLLIKAFCEITDKAAMLCAPTACAANIIKGITAHRAFWMDRKVLVPDEEPKRGAIDRLSNYDVVIIDEISMMRMDYFIYFYKLVKAAENIKGRKIQVIVVGDFFQLPPVITGKEKNLFLRYYNSNEGYAFETVEWSRLGFAPVILTENIRQDICNDYAFDIHLKRMRTCNEIDTGEECASFFNHNAKREIDDNTLRLYPRKKNANKYNREKLIELLNSTNSIPKPYTADFSGDITEEDEFPVERKIELAVGARIMTRANISGSFYNGEMGTVRELRDESIVALMDRGEEVCISKYPFEITDYNKDKSVSHVGKLTQLPVSLAYAITIHKSQGMTLNAVAIDPTCFADGQLYVALSRVKSSENLYLIRDIQPEHIKASNKVVDFYKTLKN